MASQLQVSEHRFVTTKMFSRLFLVFLFLVFPECSIATTNEPVKFEDEDIHARLVSRTPEQLAAFYIGRGFHNQAVERIQQTCFITVILKNKNIEVLWLDLDNWEFSRNSISIPRINRDYWKKQWQEVNLPLGHQSTFGWTLLPEVRDLRMHEGVGGNVVIPKQIEPFDLTMLFNTGFDKKGKVKKITFRNITCGTDK